jgi:ElaB/YqjD/DUF883 family membrane-anchored ribosome-binding protein
MRPNDNNSTSQHIAPELEQVFRDADEVREEVGRAPQEEKNELEASAHAVIQGAKSARATCSA